MEPLMSACALVGSGSVAVTIACLAVAALLLAAIALGFGPLRSWLAPGGVRAGSPGRAGQVEAGVLGTWRLYRQLRRPVPRTH